MNREEKKIEVEALKERFLKAKLLLLTDYKGLKVEQLKKKLRLELRKKAASEVKVVKNRLAKIALKGTPLEFLSEHLIGTTAVTTTDQDPTQVAKIVVKFAKDHEVVKFKAAGMEGRALNQKDLEALATLPSREELIAKLLGSMLAPARNWVSVLAQIPRQLVNVLAAVRDQKEKST